MHFLQDRYFADEALDPLDSGLLTLAAYNAGPARVAALRQNTRAVGLDPNQWFGNVEVIAAREMGRETVDNVSINDERTRVRDLRRDDQLTFYIPEDRLAVDLFDGDPATAAVQELPVEPLPAPPPEPIQATAPAPQAAPPAPVQTAPAPATRPRPALVQTPAPASSLASIGWVVFGGVALIAEVLLIRRSLRRV